AATATCFVLAVVWRSGSIQALPTDNYAQYLNILDMLPGSISSFAAGFAITFLDIRWSKWQWRIACVTAITAFLALEYGLLAFLDVYWGGHWLLIIWNPLIAL